jgi:hypothetical protein
MVALTERQVINKINKWGPLTGQALLDLCEFPVQYVGGGAFRDVYHIIGTDVVVKLPRKGANYARNKTHARHEILIWNRIFKAKTGDELAGFKQYLPNIRACDTKTGVMVVRKYEKLKGRHDKMLMALEQKVKEVFDIPNGDIHHNNVGVDKEGNIKIIDLGLLVTGKE